MIDIVLFSRGAWVESFALSMYRVHVGTVGLRKKKKKHGPEQPEGAVEE